MTPARRAHKARCRICQGDAATRPEKTLQGRPRDSWASLRILPLRWRPQTDQPDTLF